MNPAGRQSRHKNLGIFSCESRLAASHGLQITSGGTDFSNPATTYRIKATHNAENIWSDKPSAPQLEVRLREFAGISQKKGSMAVNTLVRDYGIEISDMSGLDVSYDIHVRRVFLRSGLVKRDREKDMIQVARKLNLEYPGALGLPAWRIGRQWCHFRNPQCGLYVLAEVCPKLQVKVPAK